MKIKTTSLINLLTGLNATPATKTETLTKGQGFNWVNDETVRIDLEHLDDLFMLPEKAVCVLIVDPNNIVFIGDWTNVSAFQAAVGAGAITWLDPTVDDKGKVVIRTALWTCERDRALMGKVMKYLTDKLTAEEPAAEAPAEKPAVVKDHGEKPVRRSAATEAPAEEPSTLEELMKLHRASAAEAPADKPAAEKKPVETKPGRTPSGRRARRG